MRLHVHPRVCERHPQLSERDVREAWHHAYYEAIRPESRTSPSISGSAKMIGAEISRWWER